MGPVGTLLALPVAGPMSALTWIAKQIANAAMQEMLDPTRIERALRALERRLENGELDEPAFEAEEELLLAELAEITQARLDGEKSASEEAEQDFAADDEAGTP